MVRRMEKPWATPTNLSLALIGKSPEVQPVGWELYEQDVSLRYIDWRYVSRPFFDPRVALRSRKRLYPTWACLVLDVGRSDRQRVYRLASRRGLEVRELATLGQEIQQGVFSFRLGIINFALRTPIDVYRDQFSARVKARLEREGDPLIEAKMAHLHVRHPDQRWKRLPVKAVERESAGWFVTVDEMGGPLLQWLARSGVAVRAYRINHLWWGQKKTKPRGTLGPFKFHSRPAERVAIYFRGNDQLAALLRRSHYAQVRPAHGLPPPQERAMAVFLRRTHRPVSRGGLDNPPDAVDVRDLSTVFDGCGDSADLHSPRSI